MSVVTSRKCGVYVIEQIGADRHYIGSSKSIPSRWSQHRRLLNLGRHHSQYLQNAWSKHGEKEFKFWIIEECKPDQLLLKEQQYLDSFKPVFNICPLARSREGSKQRPEVVAKIKAFAQARAAAITHCPHGHEYTPENKSIGSNGEPKCRECSRIRSRAAIAAETPEQARRRLDVGLNRYYGSRESKGIVDKWSPEYLAKLSAANKGKRPSDAALKASVEARKKDNCPAGHPYAVHGMKSKEGFTICGTCRARRSRENHERERMARESETPEQKLDRLRKRNELRAKNRDKILIQKRAYAERTREQRKAYDRDPINIARKQARRAKARAEGRAYG